MKLLNLKPSRTKAEENVDLVSDLDALIAKPITFRVLGKVHKIEPISTGDFFKVLNSLEKLHSLQRKQGKYEEKELIDAYVKFIGAVCPTIGRMEIQQMTQSQVIALVQIIIDTISGKTHAEIEKKKNLPMGMIPLPDSESDL
jgi:hypothetical protein